MSPDEPITIVEYDPRWPEQFARESARIVGALGETVLMVEHVGSTAVPHLAAKPFVDILVGVASLELSADILKKMAGLGYVCLGEAGVPGRVYFRRRDGAEAFNAHFVLPDSDNWRRNVLVREFLRSHPEEVRAYEALKRGIIASGVDRLVEYSDRKRTWMDELKKRARRWAETRDN